MPSHHAGYHHADIPREKHKIQVSERRVRPPLEHSSACFACNSLFCIFSMHFLSLLSLSGRKQVLKSGVGPHMLCLSSRHPFWFVIMDWRVWILVQFSLCFSVPLIWAWSVETSKRSSVKLKRSLKTWAFNVTELTLLALRWSTQSCSPHKTNPWWSNHFHLHRTQHSVCKDVGRFWGCLGFRPGHGVGALSQCCSQCEPFFYR